MFLLPLVGNENSRVASREGILEGVAFASPPIPLAQHAKSYPKRKPIPCRHNGAAAMANKKSKAKATPDKGAATDVKEEKTSE